MKHYKYLLFADDANIFRVMNSVDECILLQFDTERIQSVLRISWNSTIAKLGLSLLLGKQMFFLMIINYRTLL